MTIRNEYKQLKRENDLIFSTLADCDRDTITGIINTISNSCGINYEVELVRKDLIAMAASAEADGQYLPAVIGDVDAFKRGLLASMPQPKLLDYMLDSLVWLCLFGLAVSLTHLLLWGPWDCYYDAAMLGICIVVMMHSAWLLKRLVPSAWLTADKGGLYGAAQAAVVLEVGSSGENVYRWVYPALPNVGIPNIIATALFAVLTLVLRGWRTRRYNQLADARPWRDVVDTKKQ